MPEAQAKTRHRPVWRQPAGTLGELIARARIRSSALKAEEPRLRDEALARGTALSLATALRGSDVALVAEVKRASPSRGAINVDLDPADLASAYVRGSASAISVLTEPDRFRGSASDLSAVVASVRAPVIKKDFHVTPVQLYEARALGASAALLIARALDPEALAELHDLGTSIGLELVVEIRDEPELEAALAAGARIIGVNNRNLETLDVDAGTVRRLMPLIPSSIIAIAESGMSHRADVEAAAAAGADAVLVGSALSGSDNLSMALAMLTHVPRVRNVRGD